MDELFSSLKSAASKESEIHFGALLAIIFIGLVVRLVFLFQTMRYDEAFTFLNFASQPLATGLSDYSYPNNHLFHTLLVHLSYSALGNRPWVIRLPAFIAGVLLIPAGYLAARIFYGKQPALLAVALVASSSPLIEYSTNARGYTLVCLIFLALLIVGASLARQDRPAQWFAWIALSVLGFYTIPIMLYPFGIAVVWLCLSIVYEQPSFDRGSRIRKVIIASAAVILLTLALYVPAFLRSGLSSVIENRFVTPKPWGIFAAQFPDSLLSTWRQWTRDLPWAFRLLLVAGFAAGSVFHQRLSAYRIPFVAAAALWLAPLLLLQQVVPFERVWLFLLPLYFAIASAGLVYGFSFFPVGTARAPILVPAFSVILSLWLSAKVVSSQAVYYSDETGTLRDAEAITVFLKDYLKPGDRILARVPSDAPLIYYFDLYGLSREYLKTELANSRRLLIVVNKSSHQTPEELLKGMTFGSDRFASPRIIRSYESAALYQVDGG